MLRDLERPLCARGHWGARPRAPLHGHRRQGRGGERYAVCEAGPAGHGLGKGKGREMQWRREVEEKDQLGLTSMVLVKRTEERIDGPEYGRLWPASLAGGARDQSSPPIVC